MKLISSAFQQNQPIPAQYTCKGADVNPPLQFDDIPQTAKSLVLIVDDPDAPAGTWVHWVVYNIPATVSHIVENTTPEGIEGMNSFGKKAYGGPCPPSGTHRYFFKLFALDTVLSLSETVDVAVVTSAMQGHILAQAELLGTFSK